MEIADTGRPRPWRAFAAPRWKDWPSGGAAAGSWPPPTRRCPSGDPRRFRLPRLHPAAVSETFSGARGYAGAMFWLRWNTLPGSYWRLTRASRS